MDLDDEASNSQTPLLGSDLHTLRIESQPLPAGLYQSIRVSDDWLLPDFELSEQGIPWNDPPPTFLAPETGAGDTMDIDGDRVLPDLRFVAKFEPQLVVPYQVGMQLLANVGVSAPTLLAMPPQYATMLFDLPSNSTYSNSFTKTSTRQVLLADGGSVQHRYNLEFPRMDWGYKAEELPFAHPRQLVEMLPILRTWAAFGLLLKSVCTGEQLKEGNTTSHEQKMPVDLKDLLLEHAPEGHVDRPQSVEVSAATSPEPTIGLVFAGKAPGSVCSAVLQVLLNGEISVVSLTSVHSDSAGSDDNIDASSALKRRAARALEMVGDIGVWVEWLKGVLVP